MKYAVAYINFFDNILKVEIIKADNIRSAVDQHSMIKSENFPDLPEDIEEIQEIFFDFDSCIDVIEI